MLLCACGIPGVNSSECSFPVHGSGCVKKARVTSSETDSSLDRMASRLSLTWVLPCFCA
jgi:hypothetical protein